MWRTCRVLANGRRLALLQELIRRPGQSVDCLAASLRITKSISSKYLRDLNARGILRVTRIGRYVQYRIGADPEVADSSLLVPAIVEALKIGNSTSRASVFKAVTAFTHPRRITIARVLRSGPRTPTKLCRLTEIPAQSLARHIAKLTRRGLLRKKGPSYELIVPAGGLPSVLLYLACK